jgi:hypothetical protein
MVHGGGLGSKIIINENHSSMLADNTLVIELPHIDLSAYSATSLYTTGVLTIL